MLDVGFKETNSISYFHSSFVWFHFLRDCFNLFTPFKRKFDDYDRLASTVAVVAAVAVAAVVAVVVAVAASIDSDKKSSLV